MKRNGSISLMFFTQSVECNYFNMFHFDEHEHHKNLMHIKIGGKAFAQQNASVNMHESLYLFVVVFASFSKSNAIHN